MRDRCFLTLLVYAFFVKKSLCICCSVSDNKIFCLRILRVFQVNGFSKSHSMTGYRLGYIAAPPIITKVGEVPVPAFVVDGNIPTGSKSNHSNAFEESTPCCIHKRNVGDRQHQNIATAHVSLQRENANQASMKPVFRVTFVARP